MVRRWTCRARPVAFRRLAGVRWKGTTETAARYRYRETCRETRSSGTATLLSASQDAWCVVGNARGVSLLTRATFASAGQTIRAQAQIAARLRLNRSRERLVLIEDHQHVDVRVLASLHHFAWGARTGGASGDAGSASLRFSSTSMGCKSVMGRSVSAQLVCASLCWQALERAGSYPLHDLKLGLSMGAGTIQRRPIRNPVVQP